MPKQGSYVERGKTEAVGSVHEIGCGEGRLTQIICEMTSGKVRASDIGEALIASNLQKDDLQAVDFVCKNIHNLTPAIDSANTVVCCEVLEHLDDPKHGFRSQFINPPLDYDLPLFRI